MVFWQLISGDVGGSFWAVDKKGFMLRISLCTKNSKLAKNSS